jgi:hypothetical protein
MTQSKRDRRLGQIKAVEREYLVAVTAVKVFSPEHRTLVHRDARLVMQNGKLVEMPP